MYTEHGIQILLKIPVFRVSSTAGNPGNLLDFSTGNPGILLEFCQLSWKFHGAMVFVAIDMMQRWMSVLFVSMISQFCGKNCFDCRLC